MVIKEKIIKQEKLQLNIDFKNLWEKLYTNILEKAPSPLALITQLLTMVNMIFKVVLIGILIGQTVLILNTAEKRLINLRHILIKWIILIVVLTLIDSAKSSINFPELFSLLGNFFAMMMVYPSKFIKNLHLKYFSFNEKKKYDDSQDDPENYQITIWARVLVSIVVFCLNSCRFIITFIAPKNRKRVEEAIRGVNLVIVEEKYFWKLYDSNWNSKNSQAQPELPRINSQSNIRHKTTYEKLPQFLSPKGSAIKPFKSQVKNVLKYKVDDYEPFIGLHNELKFRFRDKCQMIYNLDTSELVLSYEDESQLVFFLSEYEEMQDELMLKLIYQNQSEQSAVYVRFKSKKDADLFLANINVQE